MWEIFSFIVTYLTNHAVIFLQILLSVTLGFLNGRNREAKPYAVGGLKLFLD